MEAEMFRRIADYIALVAAYTRANLRVQLEYPGAFLSQVVAMFVNDGAWVLFWVFFFNRFPVMHGWGLLDVISLWAITAAGFGIAFAIMGNSLQLATLIVQGELDLWLAQPRAVLPHMLLGRSVPSAWGDVAFGYFVYFAFVQPDFARMALFVILSFGTALVFVAMGVAAGSLSFFIGNSISFADEWRYAVVTFSTYPPGLFQGAVKVVLFSIIPAGFVSYLPVEALRSLSIGHALAAVAGAFGILAASVAVFYCGLRRYESGNLISTNG
jgi:ABC-2 type transport system permease protein